MNTVNTRMHLSLHVRNIGQSVDFYNKFFGQAPVKVKPGYAKYVLEDPGLVISFVESTEARPAFGHLGFQVATQQVLDDYRRRAEDQGLITREEQAVACCYARQNKFWVNDPDNYAWEVYLFLEDVEANDPGKSGVKADGCCTVPAAAEAACC